MKHLKVTALLAAALMAVGSMTACGGVNSPDSGSTADKGNSSGDVTLSFLRAGTSEDAQIAYQAIIDEYTKANPNVKIEYQQIGFGTELDTKLNTLYASGAAPDLVRGPISTIAQRASMGQYAALDDYIAEWDEKDNVIQTAYDVANYKGKQYGIAINIEASMLFYRKDYFEEAGLDPNKPPQTWEELLDYAEKLTVREGDDVVRAGFAFPISSNHQTLIQFARQNGATLVDEEKDEATFNDEKTIEALEYFTQYADKNLIIPFVNQKDQNPFELGNAAMQYLTLNTYVTIKASGVDWADQMMFSPGPGREKISTFGGCQIMFMSEQSKNKDAAWDFMKHLFTDDVVWKLVEETGATAVKTGLEHKFNEAYPDIGPAYLETLQYTEGMPKVEWASLFETAMKTAFEEAMYGKKDAKTALDDAYNQLNSERGI